MPSLGKDLAAIRKKKGLSIADVQQITKVPQHTLRSIEDDSIFTQIDQNTTYIRSYVRSYAKAVGVSEDDIVRALNQVEAGNYDGSLGITTQVPEETPDQEAENTDKGDSTERDDMVHDHSPEFQEKKSPKKTSPVPKASSSSTSSTLSSIDWVDVGLKANPAQRRSRVWSGLLIIVLIVAILAAIFLLYNYYNSNSSNEPPARERSTAIQPETPSDSLRESLITSENEPATADTMPVEQGTLGDTLAISIYAANGKLEPIRIYTDILGKQNPYWVPQGDTIRFNFVNTVRIRAVNQYNRLQLLFNGHVIQNYYQQYYNAETGMVELDRSVFENNPQWRTPAADTNS